MSKWRTFNRFLAYYLPNIVLNQYDYRTFHLEYLGPKCVLNTPNRTWLASMHNMFCVILPSFQKILPRPPNPSGRIFFSISFLEGLKVVIMFWMPYSESRNLD